MSPSILHSYVCSNLDGALRQFTQYMVFISLTIKIDSDYIPDLCVYPRRTLNFLEEDPVRTADMPLMLAEIVSPTQGTNDVLTKFPLYFQAGVKSCWLVSPATQTVTVYTAPKQGKIFKTGDIYDPVLDIHIPLDTLFI